MCNLLLGIPAGVTSCGLSLSVKHCKVWIHLDSAGLCSYRLHIWSGLLVLPSTSQTSDMCLPDHVESCHLQLTTDRVKTLDHCHDALQQSLCMSVMFSGIHLEQPLCQLYRFSVLFGKLSGDFCWRHCFMKFILASAYVLFKFFLAGIYVLYELF